VIPNAPGAAFQMKKVCGHAETLIQWKFCLAGTGGERRGRRGSRANGRSQTGMKFKIDQFLLKFPENACYTVAGVYSISLL
jgi:hypothetical protein